MQVNKEYFLIRIDKAEQIKKRMQTGNIIIPGNYTEMMYNLQYGEVVNIGAKAAKLFPEVEEGDILIFSHHVEYKPRADGDKSYADVHLIETFENGDELRTVDISFEVFGVLKTDTQDITPFKNIVFCHEEFKQATFQKDANGLFLPDAWKTTVETYNERLEELKQQIDQLGEQKNETKLKIVQDLTHDVIKNATGTIARREAEETRKKAMMKSEQIYREMMRINAEREMISKKMNEESYMEMTLLFINKQTAKEWGYDAKAGDTLWCHSFALYPLDIGGAHFTLVSTNYVALYKNQDMKVAKPLHNRVIIIPAVAETKSAGGIIIPDTAKVRPNQGVVLAAGPGLTDQPITVKKDDVVFYSKNAGTELTLNEQTVLLMRETDIICTIEEIPD